MQKLKVNDEVIVIAGKDKGKTGKILKIDSKNERVLISGVNIVKKMTKPNQANPAGGIVDLEKTIHISNVSYYDPTTKKSTRVGIDKKSGKSARFSKSTGKPIK